MTDHEKTAPLASDQLQEGGEETTDAASSVARSWPYSINVYGDGDDYEDPNGASKEPTALKRRLYRPKHNIAYGTVASGPTSGEVDLRTVFAAGDRQSAAVPTVLRGDDGVGCFYARRVNGLHGDKELGKTRISTAAIAEHLMLAQVGGRIR